MQLHKWMKLESLYGYIRILPHEWKKYNFDRNWFQKWNWILNKKVVDIVITKNSFWTLVNVIIVDPTHIDLVQNVLMKTTYAIAIVIQNKARSYTKRAPRNDFIPLAIETYDFFHLHFSFFTFYVHANIACHQQTSLLPSMLISYYRQWMLIAPQHVQIIVILQCIAMLNHNFSSLPPIPASAPPSLVDLWQRIPF